MILLASSLFLFVAAVVSAHVTPAEITSAADVLAAFVHVARAEGLDVRLVDAGRATPAAYWGNTGVTFELGGGMQILDLYDYEPWPAKDGKPLARLASQEFLEHYRGFVSENSFVSELALPVIVDAHLSLDADALGSH